MKFRLGIILSTIKAKGKDMYVIYGMNEKDSETGSPLYWSNLDGWVDLVSATKFTKEERNSLNLPIGGIWVRYLP